MKTLILFHIVFASMIILAKGQTPYNINNVAGTTITDCNAILYDSGGPTGAYQNSEDYTVTFCSGTTDCIQLQFTGTFNIESGWEHLYIYDGNTTSATLLGDLKGATLPSNISTSGNCVTFRFTSDGSVAYEGFQIYISCTGTCYVPPPPPSNDDPCTAFNLTVNTACNYTPYTCQSATNTTVVPAPTCSFSYAGGDVWFSAVVPPSGLLAVQIAAQIMSEGGIAFYSGADCNNLTEIMCNEQAWGTMPPTQYVNSVWGLAGQTLWIRVWEPNNDNPGIFNICAFEPPPFLEVDTTLFTPQLLVQKILLSGYLTSSNVTYTGSPNAIGYFQQGNSLGFTNGIILSTGNATDVMGYGNLTGSSTDFSYNGDTTLNLVVSPDLTHDAAVLEFDFIPLADSLNFRFIFGSDEYPEFAFSFNDVFGFFLTGPNPSGQNYNSTNIALVPVNPPVPVSIYNVNNGSSSPTTGPCVNCQYYVDNTSNLYPTSFDGFTTPLTAKAHVIPCQTYHIKLAIADVNDGILDSGVLLEGLSFSSGGGKIEINNPETACSVDTLVNLSANVLCGTWSGQGISDSNQGHFNPSLAGIGNHKVYYSLPYETDSAIICVTACSGITEKGNSKIIRIYPNPNKDILHIELADILKYNINIFDIKGTLVYSTFGNSSELSINTSEFESGYYSINISSDNNEVFHSKLIIE